MKSSFSIIDGSERLEAVRRPCEVRLLLDALLPNRKKTFAIPLPDIPIPASSDIPAPSLKLLNWDLLNVRHCPPLKV